MQLFLTAFESVDDPRAENVRHDLIEILLIAFLAVLCGAQHCSEMAAFGRAKRKFLKRFLKLGHGIPSHDTFSTVFRMLDPKALDAAFGRLTATLVAALAKGSVVAIDGKSLKGAYDKGEKSSPRMMVSAYAAGLRLTLATVAAKDRNEGRRGARGDRADRSQGQDRHRRCAALQPADGRGHRRERRRLLHRTQG
jgi:hypothetical protein